MKSRRVTQSSETFVGAMSFSWEGEWWWVISYCWHDWLLAKGSTMRPTSQQGQGIRHRINCMGWCARISTVLADTSSSPLLSRGIFSTKSHTRSSGSQMYFSWRMQQWILNAINMLPVTQHGNLLCYNLGEMLNQLPWLTKLYCFLNEQQYITEFSAWF